MYPISYFMVMRFDIGKSSAIRAGMMPGFIPEGADTYWLSMTRIS